MKNTVNEHCRDDITIIWKPNICIHAGICVNTLPSVYKPGERPWINQNNASKEELIEQISLCPSKALSYKLNE